MSESYELIILSGMVRMGRQRIPKEGRKKERMSVGIVCMAKR